MEDFEPYFRAIEDAVAQQEFFIPAQGAEPHFSIDRNGVAASYSVRVPGTRKPRVISAIGATVAEATAEFIDSIETWKIVHGG